MVFLRNLNKNKSLDGLNSQADIKITRPLSTNQEISKYKNNLSINNVV